MLNVTVVKAHNCRFNAALIAPAASFCNVDRADVYTRPPPYPLGFGNSRSEAAFKLYHEGYVLM